MKKLSFLIMFLLSVSFVYPQANVVEFIKAGTEDASKLIKPYLDPFALALGDGLNNGWYYTAETHDRFGFDFSMGISAVKIPNSAKTFDISQIQLSDVVLDPGFGSIAQTAAGAEMDGPKLNLKDPDNPNDTLGSFRSPPGLNMDVVPVPVAQLGIGLFPHTDILVRYVPKIRFNQQGDEEEDVKVGMLGFGVKHSFKDWVPVLKTLPFDAAVFASWSNINANTGINFELEDYGIDETPPNYVPDEDQQLDIQTNTVKLGLIVSKKLAFITFFGAIGNSRSNTKVDLLGRYPVVKDVVDDMPVVEDEIDPIKLRFESSRLSLDAGLRLKFSYFNIFASINKAEYTSLNAGVALSVR